MWGCLLLWCGDFAGADSVLKAWGSAWISVGVAWSCGGSYTLTLPVWVDHVGAAGTGYAVGELKDILGMPPVERLPSVAKA